MPSNPIPTQPAVSQEYDCEICHRDIPDGTGFFVPAGNRVGDLHLCRLCFINVTKEAN